MRVSDSVHLRLLSMHRILNLSSMLLSSWWSENSSSFVALVLLGTVLGGGCCFFFPLDFVLLRYVSTTTAVVGVAIKTVVCSSRPRSVCLCVCVCM